MYTQCPECEIAFRVTAKVLQQAAGNVRCGSCGHAFSALEYLSEEMPGDEEAAEPVRDELAETSRRLLQTLDELAGPDPVRIEDTGVEWRVMDVETEPADERRYDDNSPLPDEIDDGVPYEPPPPPVREPDDDSQAEAARERHADLALSEPEDWTDILEEFSEVNVADLGVEEELAAIHSELATSQAIAVDDGPENVESQFETQAEAMGLEIGSIDDDLTDEVPQLDEESSSDESLEDLEAEQLDEAEAAAIEALLTEHETTGEFEAQIEVAARALANEEIEVFSDAERPDDDEADDEADIELAADEDAEDLDEVHAAADSDDEELTESDSDDDDEELDELLAVSDSDDDDEEDLDELLAVSDSDDDEMSAESDDDAALEDLLGHALDDDDEDNALIEALQDDDEYGDEYDEDEGDEDFVESLEDSDEEADEDEIEPADDVDDLVAALPETEADFTARLAALENPEELFDESSGEVETIIMEGEFIRSEVEKERLAAENAARTQLDDPASLADTYAMNRGKVRGGRRSYDPPSAVTLSLAAALLLLLAGQFVHQSRESLATIGFFQSTIAPVYRILGSPITPSWDIRGWQFEATNGSVDSEETTLTIVSRIGNRSEEALPYPLVHVSLTNRFEDIMGSRILEPGDYLAGGLDPSELVQPGDNFTAVVTIENPSDDATGFKLNVCYRVEIGTVRCAIEDFK